MELVNFQKILDDVKNNSPWNDAEEMERQPTPQEFWLGRHDFLPPDFLTHTKNIDSKFSSEEIDLINKYDEGEDSFGFFITGKAGVGKTFCLQSLCRRIVNTTVNYKCSPIEFVKYYPVGILLSELRDFGSSKNQSTLVTCTTKKFLFLDDLGAEYSSDYSREQLFTILDTRLQKRLPTFITSNLSLGEVKDKYSERIASRIKEMTVAITLTGDDKRNDIYKERIQKLRNREVKNV